MYFAILFGIKAADWALDQHEKRHTSFGYDPVAELATKKNIVTALEHDYPDVPYVPGAASFGVNVGGYILGRAFPMIGALSLTYDLYRATRWLTERYPDESRMAWEDFMDGTAYWFPEQFGGTKDFSKYHESNRDSWYRHHKQKKNKKRPKRSIDPRVFV